MDLRMRSEFDSTLKTANPDGRLLILLNSAQDAAQAAGGSSGATPQAARVFSRSQHGLKTELSVDAPGTGFRLTVEYDAALAAGKSGLEVRWLVSNELKRILAMIPLQTILVNSSPSRFRPLDLTIAKDIDGLARHPNPHCLTRFFSDWSRLDHEDCALAEKLVDSYRQWVNENPHELTSIAIGHRLQALSKELKLKMTTLQEADLDQEGLVLLRAVGQGSDLSPPRLHIIEYVPPGCEKQPFQALIGKGITFDTGGINVKHHDNFVNTMKNDMSGAALAVHLFEYLVRRQVQKPLLLVVPTCENSVDGRSFRPGTIYKTASGQRVVVEHTDAEGRLILSDAFTYVQKHHDTDCIASFASLTTASMRQYSHFFTPVHFSDKRWRAAIRQAGAAWGENFVFPPEFLPFAEANQTKLADLTNLGSMRAKATGAAGSSVAAHFLKQFAKVPLVHLDIFATAWNWGEDYPSCHIGATGAPFLSLSHALYNLFQPDNPVKN